MNAFLIISNEELAMKNGENWRVLGEEYFSWVREIGENGWEVTGEVVKMDWVSEER